MGSNPSQSPNTLTSHSRFPFRIKSKTYLSEQHCPIECCVSCKYGSHMSSETFQWPQLKHSKKKQKSSFSNIFYLT